MRALDATAEKCLLVVDENNKLLGTLTDGDLRRSILGGTKFSENISACFNTEPTILEEGSYAFVEAQSLLQELKLNLLSALRKPFDFSLIIFPSKVVISN
jgi:signal-transduction protein with cAMP-binding, CBS, and nucleotidyltransferase domain